MVGLRTGHWASPANRKQEPAMSSLKLFQVIADRVGPALMLVATALVSCATVMAVS